MKPQASASPLSRRAGVLAHVSSLAGPIHCGDFGFATSRFLEWCESANLRLWQVLPLGPTGPGHSPYSSTSAFACNPTWYAHRNSRQQDPGAPLDRCDLKLAASQRRHWLEQDWHAFRHGANVDERRGFEAYRDSEEQQPWLEDWTLYAALKEHHDGRAWFEWDGEFRRREPRALRSASKKFAERQAYHAWVQYTLDAQARSVRASAEARDILWLGDLPFGVALDSADVWSRRDLFRVDVEGNVAATAGVPPDDYSSDGQCWNTPLFDWEALSREDYAWWLARCRSALRWVHALRVDHFRGYCSTWEIPAGAERADAGRWVDVPGDELFGAVREAGLGSRLVAEDLGVITAEVTALRERFGFPGMHVLQFGLDDPESAHHPDQHRKNALACTGTHDSDTFNGWYAQLDADRRERVDATLGSTAAPARAAIARCWKSPAAWVVAPLQDMLELGSAARMNRPGKADGQWTWRCDPALLDERRGAWLSELALLYGRAS